MTFFVYSSVAVPLRVIGAPSAAEDDATSTVIGPCEYIFL